MTDVIQFDRQRKEVKVVETKNWAINALAAHDLRFPGLAGHFVRSSHERRQVITCFLALCDDTVDVDQLWPLLPRAGHDQILGWGMTDVPPGIRKALARATKASHPRKFYTLLVEILSNSDAADRARFNRLQALDLDLLRRWKRAPVELRTKAMLDLLPDVDAVDELLAAIDLLAEHGVARQPLLAKLASVGSRKGLAAVFSQAIKELQFPNAPVSGNSDITPVTSIVRLREIGKTLNNCAANYVYEVMNGTSYFYVVDPDNPTAIAHLERESGEWVLTDIVARSNRPVSRARASAIFAYFEEVGIGVSPTCRPSRWSAVQRFARG